MKANPLADGFRRGIIAGMDVSPPAENLTRSKQQMSLSAIARAYQTSRQSMHKLRQRHNLDTAAFTNPDQLFLYLLEHSRACRLRRILSDPATRQIIFQRIQAIL